MPGESSIVVVCKCGKKLKAPAAAAGKKARCPACANTLVLTPGTAAQLPPLLQLPSHPLLRGKRRQLPHPGPLVQRLRFRPTTMISAHFTIWPRRKIPPLHRQTPRDARSVPREWTKARFCARTAAMTPAQGKPSLAPSPETRSTVATKKKKDKPIDMMAPQGSFVLGIVVSAALRWRPASFGI